MNEQRGVIKHIEPKDARDLVRQWIERRTHVGEAQAPSLLEATFKDFLVDKTPPSYQYRLIDPLNQEEGVFRIQGMLSSAALPPYEPDVRFTDIRSQSLRFVYQHVGIIGFDSDLFKKQMEKVRELHLHFHRSSTRLHMKPYLPCSMDDFPELVCKTRLFTTGKDAREFPAVPIPGLLDSNGVIASLCERPDVSFTDKNLVSYQALEIDSEDGTRRYIDIRPEGFHLGDIVEMEFSAIAVPVSQGGMGGPKGHTFLLVLRGLTRLDESLSIEAAKQEIMEASHVLPPVAPVTKAVKRRVGYNREDEEMRDARKRVALMEMEPAAEA